MFWEKGRQLKQFGSNIYDYNNRGVRIKKVTNTEIHDYILDGTNIVKEVVTDICNCPKYSNEYLYDLDGMVCGLKHNGTAYYFYKNLQGDVIAITDDSGKTIARYTYDAWGKCTIVSDNSDTDIATINPFRYRSYYYDAETGLYYLQSRYYDPEVGRFISADNCRFLGANGVIVGYNLFSYGENIPTMTGDPCGNFVSGISVEAQAAWIVGVFVVWNIFFDGNNVLLSYGVGGQIQLNGSASVSVGIQHFPKLNNVSKTLRWGTSSSLAYSWGVYLSAGGTLDMTNMALGGSISVGLGASVFPLTYRLNIGYTWKIRQYTIRQLLQYAIRTTVYFYALGIRIVKMRRENRKYFTFELLKTRYKFRLKLG